MRLRTAAMLSIVLVGVMFALPRAGAALANWYVEHPVRIPLYARVFLEIGIPFSAWWWIFTPVTVSILFTIAIFTAQLRRGN